MGFHISLLKFQKNSLSERLLEGKAVSLWDKLTEHKAVSQKASFQLLTEDISFFTIALHGLQISLSKLPRKSLSERLLERKAVSLWDQLTEHKAVSQKASFQFLTEDNSFFTIAPYGLPNITLQIPEEQSSRKATWGESCNSVRWIKRTQSSFSESFFPVFNWRYFLFHHNRLWAYKIWLCKFHKNSLSERPLKGKAVSLWDKLTEHKAVSQKAFFQILT